MALVFAFGGLRSGWVQVVRGSIDVSGERCAAGDGMAFDGGETVMLSGGDGAEVMFFDVP